MSQIQAEKEQGPFNHETGEKRSRWSRLVNFFAGTRKRFYLSMAYVLAFLLLLVAGLHYVISVRSDYQERRNLFLKGEVAKLDRQIAEIKILRTQTEALLSRKEVVGYLLTRGKKDTSVLDQLACRIVPNGIYLTGIDKDSDKYTIQGVADTAASVTSLMNKLENSALLYNGKILRINEAGQPGDIKRSNPVNFIIEASASPGKPETRASAETGSSKKGADSGMSELQGNDASDFSNLAWLTLAVIVLAVLLWGLRRILRLIRKRSPPAMRDGGGISGKLQNMTDQLRSVAPQDVGAWPPMVRFMVLGEIMVLLSIAGWQVVTSDFDTYSESAEIESRLKENFLSKEREAVNLDLIKKQLLGIQKNFGPMLRKFPGSQNELNDRYYEAIRLIQENGLHLIDSQPQGAEMIKGPFAQMNWSLKVGGSFDRTGHFISDLSNSNTFLSLQSYNLAPASPEAGNGGDMILEATLTGYRYLNETEMAAQRKIRNSGAKK